MRQMFATKPAFTPIDPYKILYNVGCLMDLPTGSYVRGQRGENIINGGLGSLVAVVGKNNTFKSTIMHYMTLSAASKVAGCGYSPYINTYDTEMNIHPERLLYFSKRFEEFSNCDIIDQGEWNITDSTKHMGGEWFGILKNFLRGDKVKKAKDITLATPFIDKKGSVIVTMFPTFGQVDSLTKFMTSDVEEMGNKNEIGESGGNTIFMRQGLGKARLLAELPIVCNSAAHYTITTAHVVLEGNAIGSSPHQMPTKKLQHMKMGEKIKGAPDDFFFLTNSLWQATSSKLLSNKDTKGPEFPRRQGDNEAGSADLNEVAFKLLRNKSGPSGYSFSMIVSQTEGVLASLTEFYFIKENDRYGLEGNNTTYRASLYPSISLMRTTVREQLDKEPRLRRAIKITADMLQIKQLCRELPFEVPTPKELYEKLGKEYDWEQLLDTRDHWTFNQYEHPVPFLSTLDLVEMYHGLYVPYWWDAKKAEAKKEGKAKSEK